MNKHWSTDDKLFGGGGCQCYMDSILLNSGVIGCLQSVWLIVWSIYLSIYPQVSLLLRQIYICTSGWLWVDWACFSIVNHLSRKPFINNLLLFVIYIYGWGKKYSLMLEAVFLFCDSSFCEQKNMSALAVACSYNLEEQNKSHMTVSACSLLLLLQF